MLGFIKNNTQNFAHLTVYARAMGELCKKTEIDHKLILEWANLANLYRIKEYSDLLEEAGVDTVTDLAKRVPESLHAKMLEVSVKKTLVNRPPPLSDVRGWVEQAKKLTRVVEC